MSNREQYIYSLRDRVLKLEWHDKERYMCNYLIKRFENMTDEYFDDSEQSKIHELCKNQ